ncbi:MAG: alpha/beta fold hydrolase [Candidatus Cloacimonadales bacterium]
MDFSKYHQPFSHKTDRKIAVLVIHGFTSTTSSMLPIAHYFADQGLNVELPTLSGHGSKWQDLNEVSYLDWVEDLERAYQKLQKRAEEIYLCGLSLGGGLALYLANKHPEISGLILINHACVFTDPSLWFVPIIKKFLPSVKAIASDIADPSQKEIAYARTPTAGVHEMLKMLKIVRQNLAQIHTPTLIFKSRQDHVIPIKSAIFTYNKLPNPTNKLLWLDRSYHVATLDYDQNFICEKSLEFIRENSESN